MGGYSGWASPEYCQLILAMNLCSCSLFQNHQVPVRVPLLSLQNIKNASRVCYSIELIFTPKSKDLITKTEWWTRGWIVRINSCAPSSRSRCSTKPISINASSDVVCNTDLCVVRSGSFANCRMSVKIWYGRRWRDPSWKLMMGRALIKQAKFQNASQVRSWSASHLHQVFALLTTSFLDLRKPWRDGRVSLRFHLKRDKMMTMISNPVGMRVSLLSIFLHKGKAVFDYCYLNIQACYFWINFIHSKKSKRCDQGSI